MDYRDLLLIETHNSGYVRDNDAGFEGAQGAYVINEEGSCILQIGPDSRVLIIPRFEADAEKASRFVDRLLWAAARLRKGGIPSVSPGSLLESLKGQLPDVGLQKLYAKPGTAAWAWAWAWAWAERGDLPLVEALGDWGDWPIGSSVVLGLTYPEELGVSLQAEDVQGLGVFPRFVAAAQIAE